MQRTPRLDSIISTKRRRMAMAAVVLGPRVHRVWLAAVIALASAGPIRSDPERVPRLEPLFLETAELPPGWEIVTESGADVRGDPILLRAGVRERIARHYTRARGPRSEVCSVELWSFASRESAVRGLRMLPEDAAELRQVGPLVISLRGVTLVRMRGSHHDVFPDCVALGDEIEARALRALGAAARWDR